MEQLQLLPWRRTAPPPPSLHHLTPPHPPVQLNGLWMGEKGDAPQDDEVREVSAQQVTRPLMHNLGSVGCGCHNQENARVVP